MAATLVEVLPQFRLNFDLGKALETHGRTHKTFFEGSLDRGVFKRDTTVSFEANLAARGVKRQEFDGRVSFALPINLGKAEMTALRTLNNRLVKEAELQTQGMEDQWEFVPTTRADKAWFMKVKTTKTGEFVPEINGGEVTQRGYEGVGDIGAKVKVEGRFGIWMNPERGQYGLKFDAIRIDF